MSRDTITDTFISISLGSLLVIFSINIPTFLTPCVSFTWSLAKTASERELNNSLTRLGSFLTIFTIGLTQFSLSPNRILTALARHPSQMSSFSKSLIHFMISQISSSFPRSISEKTISIIISISLASGLPGKEIFLTIGKALFITFKLLTEEKVLNLVNIPYNKNKYIFNCSK